MSTSETGWRRVWRAARIPGAVLILLVVVAVLASLGDEQFPEGQMEPGGVDPQGGRALVQTMQEDRDVHVVRSADDAEQALDAAGDDSVLAVFLDHRLEPGEVRSLAELETDTLLVQPTLQTLDEFAPGVDMSGRTESDETLDGECGLSAAESAGPADVAGELYEAAPGQAATECYAAAAGSAVVQVEHGAGTTTVVGTDHFMTNTELADEGNAALAMNLMAAEDVVWLRPHAHVPEDSATLTELLPQSLLWSAVPLMGALLLLALWHGRRLGALVPESLPVVVRAAETTEGRAGLYHSRKARDRAAAALRAGFLDRVSGKLGLRPDTPQETVVSALATRLGEDPVRVRALLYPEPPDPYAGDDEALNRLAEELDERSRRLR